ncbi:MAG: polyisoprenoid-binding protein YceI, partial [Limisphaerales bacterium]
VISVVSMTAFGQDIRRSYQADADNSSVTWKGFKVTGSHHGTINIESGSLQFNNDILAGGEFSVDMTSMKCVDLDEKNGAKLIGHLSSPDFFNIQEYPTAKIKITSVASRGPVGEYKVTADVTIKDNTSEVKFLANVNFEGRTATAELEIDRSEFDVKYGSGSFFQNLGDKTIYDEFKMGISLVMLKD